jgi:hypothetical protein
MSKLQTAFVSLVALISGLAIGLWGADLKGANDQTFWFLVSFALFVLKVFLDDLSHFSTRGSAKVLARGFWFAIGMWILFMAITGIALSNLAGAVFLMLTVVVIGTLWIALNHVGVETRGEKELFRQRGWMITNCLYILLLASYLAFSATLFQGHSTPVFWAIGIIVVIDAFLFGTVERLTT